MAAIFWFSAQNGVKSENMSGSVALKVFGVLHNGAEPPQSATFMETLNTFIRKTAHFTIYFILGFCVTHAVRQVKLNGRYIFLISLILSSFYAATDEWHQYFVPGRECRWQDWLIDTSGILLGVCVTLFIAKIKKNHPVTRNK